jgi:hypothetical protein
MQNWATGETELPDGEKDLMPSWDEIERSAAPFPNPLNYSAAATKIASRRRHGETLAFMKFLDRK